MSEIICSVCGKPITHCPNCFAKIPSLESPSAPNILMPSIPTLAVDVRPDKSESTITKRTWDYKTALPYDSLEIENQPNAIRRGISDFFDANAEPCTCLRDKDGNVIPNPNIKRASLSEGVSPSSPLAPKFVKNSYGNYNVEELAKIAVDQQMRAEKRRKRKMRWIRRGIVFCIIISLILTNWDMFYFACKTFLNGIDAVFEIWGLLGDL